MARTKNSYESGGNLIIVRSATRDEDKKEVPAHFISIQKVGDKWVRDVDTFSSIRGDITKIEVETDEYEGAIKKTAKIFLKDKEVNESYLLDLRFNILNRGILNSLLTLESTENVSIDLYKNAKGFNASSVKQNGNRVSWKHAFSDLPAPEVILHPKTKAVIARDYTELDNFFEDELIQLAKNLNVEAKAKSSEDAPSSSTAKEEDDWA